MKNIVRVLAVIICIGFVAQVAYCADAKVQAEPQATNKIVPKKVQIDANYDGKVDRTEYYDPDGKPVKSEVDNDGDGVIDETVIYKDGKPVKSEKDTNKDGKPDVWIDL